MKPFLENNNLDDLEAIQEYMDENGIEDPDNLTERDYELIEEANVNGFNKKLEHSLSHLAKYKVQASNQKEDWMDTVRNGLSLVPELSKNELKKYPPEIIEKIYQKAIRDKDFYNETHLKPSDLPKTAVDAFGTNDILKLGDWEYIKDNIIVPNAIHDKKDELEELWNDHKWEKRKSKYEK